jgi:tetratricopeptide (TPR) repeat protein
MLRLTVLLLCFVVAAPVPADAGRRSSSERKLKREAKKHKTAGLKHLKRRKLDAAIEELQIAYGLSHEPILLFHIAEAFNAKQDYAQALYYYGQFADADPRTAKKMKVADVIDALTELTAPAPEPEPEPAPEPEPEPEPVIDDPEPVADDALEPPPFVIEPPRPRGSAGRGRRVAGVVFGVGGVLMAGAGGVLAKIARDRSDTITELFDRGGTWDDDFARIYDEGQQAERGSLILLSAGGAAVVTGVVLYTLGVRARGDGRVEVGPAAAGTGASVRIAW